MKKSFAEQTTALVNEVLNLIHNNSFEMLTVRNLKFMSQVGQAAMILNEDGFDRFVPIAAGVGCTTGILVKICSGYLKKKEQNYKLKYTIIQKTLDDFRQLYVTSLKDNHIDENEYHRFVTQFENYREASQVASQEIHTKSRAASRTASHTKSQVASHATANATANTASHTPPTIPLKPHNFL